MSWGLGVPRPRKNSTILSTISLTAAMLNLGVSATSDYRFLASKHNAHSYGGVRQIWEEIVNIETAGNIVF